MNTLKAEKRSLDVKAKRLRREGYVVGNVFGREMKESIPVKMVKRDVEKLLKTDHKGSQIMLDVDGAAYDVLIKNVDYNPVAGQIDSIEFQALVSNEKVHSVAEIVLVNHEKIAEGVLQEDLNQILATGGNCQIQYAALKENNYEYPKTLEEYEALIKQYLAAHPKTDDGLDTIGISMSAADWHWLITLSNPAGFIADGAPDNGSWLVDDNYNCIYKHVSDKEKEYFRWLSRMYDEGILDPNFATQTDDDYIAKLASGRVVAITDAFWHYAQAEATLKAEGKLDKTYCPLPVTIDAETKAPTLMYQGLQVGYGMAITKSCEDPVRAIKFLDYLCSDEGAVLYKWGVEGENYFVDENGMRYRTEEEIAKASSDPDYGKNTGIGNYTGFPIYGDGAVDENGNPYTPVTRESVIAEYNEEQKAACEAWNVEMLTDIFPQPDEFETPPYSPLWAYATPQEITNNVEILNEIAWPGLIKCVTESVDNFDANWDKLIADYEANGLEETEQMMTDFLAEKIS